MFLVLGLQTGGSLARLMGHGLLGYTKGFEFVNSHPFNNYVIWPGSLVLMNCESITSLRNLLNESEAPFDQKDVCDVIIERVYRVKPLCETSAGHVNEPCNKKY